MCSLDVMVTFIKYLLMPGVRGGARLHKHSPLAYGNYPRYGKLRQFLAFFKTSRTITTATLYVTSHPIDSWIGLIDYSSWREMLEVK